MKHIFRPLAAMLAITALSGCGLKGPLYFPPADKSASPQTRPVSDGTQIVTPDPNDRRQDDQPTQVIY